MEGLDLSGIVITMLRTAPVWGFLVLVMGFAVRRIEKCINDVYKRFDTIEDGLRNLQMTLAATDLPERKRRLESLEKSRDKMELDVREILRSVRLKRVERDA